METAIINNENSAVDEKAEIQLLWFAALFSKKVYLTSRSSIYFCKELVSKTDLRGNLKYFRMCLPLFAPQIKFEEFDEVVDAYFYRKKQKHKSKEMLLINMKAERFFKWLESEYNKWIKGLKEIKQVHVLNELNDLPSGKVIFDSSPFSEKSELNPYNPMIIAILDIIECRGIIPVLDISIRKTKIYKKNFSLADFDGKLIVSPDHLFRLPAPMELKLEQLKIVRSEFIPVFDRIFDILGDLNKVKENFAFYQFTFWPELGKIADMMLSKRDVLQSLIDSQVYMSYLRSQCRDLPELKVHLGFCSNENLLRIYWEQKMISDDLYLFLRDVIKKKMVNMKACVPLLVVDRGCEGA